MSAKITAEAAYVDSSCNEQTSTVAADGSFYAKIHYENTGTEDIPNARLRLNSYDSNANSYGNMAHVWITLQDEIDIRVGQTVTLCVEVANYYSMRPGTWRYYFFPHTSHSTGLGPADSLYLEVENEGDYAHLELTNFPGHTEQGVGEETSYEVDIVQHGQGPFDGRLYVTWYAYWTDTGNSGTRDFALGEGERVTQGHTIKSADDPDSRHYNYVIWHDSNQRVFTSSRQIDIGGGGPILQQHKLYTNQSVYFDGDSAFITLDLRNRGEAEAGPGSYLRFIVDMIRADGSTKRIHEETASLENLGAGQRRDYVSDTFTVDSEGEPLSNFRVRFIPYYESGNTIRCYSCSPVYYTVKSYDPQETCEPSQSGSEDLHDTHEESYCADESITFIELTRDDPYRIDVINGTMYGWNEGYNDDGLHGVFIYGEPGLEVHLVYLLKKVIELPSVSLASIMVASIVGFLGLAAFSRRTG